MAERPGRRDPLDRPSTDIGAPDRMIIGPLPIVWSRGATPDLFQSSGILPGHTLRSTVRVYEPLEADTRYLLERVGAQTVGPLGRPRVESLPDNVADGISVVAFDEASDGSLSARIDLVRRAWDRDIVVSARAVPVEAVDPLVDAMLELLASVRPAEVEA